MDRVNPQIAKTAAGQRQQCMQGRQSEIRREGKF